MWIFFLQFLRFYLVLLLCYHKDALFCTWELRPLVRRLVFNWMNTRNITGQVNHQILGLELVYIFVKVPFEILILTQIILIFQESDRVVTKKEGINFARESGCLFIECSAKTRVNVQQCFEELVLKVWKPFNCSYLIYCVCTNLWNLCIEKVCGIKENITVCISTYNNAKTT